MGVKTALIPVRAGEARLQPGIAPKQKDPVTTVRLQRLDIPAEGDTEGVDIATQSQVVEGPPQQIEDVGIGPVLPLGGPQAALPIVAIHSRALPLRHGD